MSRCPSESVRFILLGKATAAGEPSAAGDEDIHSSKGFPVHSALQSGVGGRVQAERQALTCGIWLPRGIRFSVPWTLYA